MLLIIDEDIYVIIEDKTYSNESKDQIKTYMEKLKDNNTNNIVEKANEENIFPIYYKTGDESFQKMADKKNQSITTILRDQIIDIFEGYKGSNIIFQDYLLNLINIENKRAAFQTRDLRNSYFSEVEIIGFYHKLDEIFKKLKDEEKTDSNFISKLIFDWHYVSNPNGGFMCYYFSSIFDLEKDDYPFSLESDLEKHDYYFQIESAYDSSNVHPQEDIMDQNTKEIYNANKEKLKLVLKLASKDKNSALLPLGLDILRTKWEKEEDFYKLTFRKGAHMTQGIVRNFISLNDNGTINVEETAKEIIKNIQKLFDLKDQLKLLK